ncbi:MAG: hypothetical protein RB292_02905 [Patescibacteria group bacterium]|jgi:signal transduction protein with GAF and PtsI domain|nr:hypothetical protein [Patescibacteria group bacterium]
MAAKIFNKSGGFEQDILKDLDPEKPSRSPDRESGEVLSSVESPELRTEILKEIDKSRPEKIGAEKDLPGVGPSVSPAVKTKTLVDIENILQQDLEDTYFRMDPDLQKKFKSEGENVAAKIERMLKEGRVKAKKVFKLIWQWLKLIPKVNKFFIKQEAKIKTDKILKIK